MAPQPNDSLGLAPLSSVLSPPSSLVSPKTPPRLFDSAVAHFASVSWCAKLLQHPTPAIAFVPPCFTPASPRQNQFIGATLATPRALRHMLCFFRPDDALHLRDPARPVTRVSTLVALGDGLCGYEGILHGGMVATLIDEAFAAIHDTNKALGKTGVRYATNTVTASLSIKYLRPAPAQGEVCITAWVESAHGRKTSMRCELTGPEGDRLAEAESTWVTVKPRI